MRVSKPEIKNLLGIEQLEIAPGSVTVISGKNASGKTSVLESIKAALGGGHDGTLLRKGAKEGEIFLEGIPSDRVNSARQIELAVEVARIRSKELNLVLCDGLEKLDEKHRKAFEKTILENGLQAIITQVTDGDLALVTEQEASA